MADLGNSEKNTISIEDKIDGYDMIVNPDGSINTAVFQGFPTRATYSTSIPTLYPPANATDCIVIKGSATKLIRVLYIQVYMTQTTAGGTHVWFLWKRSSDDTGGTRIPLTPIPHDSNQAAATASISEFLANPTGLGTSVGITHRAQIYHSDATSNVQTGVLFDLTKYGFDKGIVLRGTSEILALARAGIATPAGLTVYGQITHSEE